MKRTALLVVLLLASFGLGATHSAQADRYRIDARQSTFTAHAHRGGLLWVLGHDHLLAIREFTGEAEATPGSLAPASLKLVVRADSLEETSPVFTDAQKKIIGDEVRTLVLETSKYPEIVFQSTSVTAKQTAPNQYEVKIRGDLALHGVTRQIVIPATVIVDGSDLRARGEFDVDRDDYEVKATSAKKGTIRVRNNVDFAFDIVAHKT
jgi:polyisoprenoid-binding protein YceI